METALAWPAAFDPNNISPAISGIGGATGTGGVAAPQGITWSPDNMMYNFAPQYQTVAAPPANNLFQNYDASNYLQNYNFNNDYQNYDFGGGYDFGEPIVLDLTGNGLNLTQQSQSNVFFDMTGDGYKNRTAWAGVGNGVLFVDLSGAGQLTQANQMIFTDWDPSASTDAQALQDVFDTNHNGQIDAGDADFSKFYVSETNADGTRSVYSLSALGISSINLSTNAVHQMFADGSSIDSEMSFTYANGSTGTAASVSLSYDSSGHVVNTTTTRNADASTTISNVALSGDGSIAHMSPNVSASGLVFARRIFAGRRGRRGMILKRNANLIQPRRLIGGRVYYG